MFVWVGTPGTSADPLGQALITFCGSVGVNVLFLDIWNYLGGDNWTNARRDTMKSFIATANASGIRVYALAGNTDWGRNQQWVGRNIVRPLAAINAYAHAFDGVLFDVEYWTDTGYDAQANLPGLLTLLTTTRQVLGKPVGLFATQWLMAGQTVNYRGETKTEGQLMLDVADHIVVACYDNNAGTAPGARQIAEFADWFAYAQINPGSASLWCGSETGLPGPFGYQGSTKAVMEASHQAISSTFAVSTSLAFRGQAIDAYASYSTMP